MDNVTPWVKHGDGGDFAGRPGSYALNVNRSLISTATGWLRHAVARRTCDLAQH